MRCKERGRAALGAGRFFDARHRPELDCAGEAGGVAMQGVEP